MIPCPTKRCRNSSSELAPINRIYRLTPNTDPVREENRRIKINDARDDDRGEAEAKLLVSF